MRSVVVVMAFAACAAPPSADAVRAAFTAEGGRAFAVVSSPRPSGGWLVAGGLPAERGAVAWFTRDGACVARRALGDDVAYAAALGSGGAEAAVAMASGEVLLLAIPSLEPRPCWRHGKAAVAVAFAPAGDWLASGGYDGVVLCGPVAGGTPVSLEQGAPATSLQFAADGQRLLVGTRDGKVRLFERTGRLLRTWNRLGGEVVAVSFTAAGATCEVRGAPATAVRPLELPWP